MVGLSKRMRKLQELLDIRIGPGAATISPNVQRIHMVFAKKFNNGHMGPRKLWHENLPRLKYHNPAVTMTVERTGDQESPATLTIHFKANQKGPDPSQDTAKESSHVIDMKGRSSSTILQELMRVVDGKEVAISQTEQEQLENLEEQHRRSDHDRRVMRDVTTTKKREQEFLAQAKRSVEAQTSV